MKYLKNEELREEEKEAIRLIIENNGEIHEADLFNKMNLPRTSTWRMVKRLEEMRIVEIRKVRRANVIKLRK